MFFSIFCINFTRLTRCCLEIIQWIIMMLTVLLGRYTRERHKSKITMSNCIEGITGKAGNANFWRDRYGSLVNISLNTTSTDSICDSLNYICFGDGMHNACFCE